MTRASILNMALSLSLLTISPACAPAQTADPVQLPANNIVSATATYLGNEGLFIQQGATKILMDPLFLDGFGVYQMVPDDIIKPLNAGSPPYDGIDAIFVSHMHPDHFSGQAVIAYLTRHTSTRLYAPSAAVANMRQTTSPSNPIFARVTSIELALGDRAKTFAAGDLEIDVLRVPHAGGARHANVTNLIWRVTLDNTATVMHLGDATPDTSAYIPYSDHFSSKRTDTAFPPYWHLESDGWRSFIDKTLNADSAIGIHVPVELPPRLANSDAEYFHTPGETKSLRQTAD